MSLTCHSDWEIKNAYRILVMTLHCESQDSMVIVTTKLYARQHGIGLWWPMGRNFFPLHTDWLWGAHPSFSPMGGWGVEAYLHCRYVGI